MFKRVFISSMSVAALTVGSITPAFAYVYDNMPRSYEGSAIGQTNSLMYPRVLGYPYPGSAIHHDRGITSRVVYRRAERMNRPDVGYIRRRGGDRMEAEPDRTGRVHLPVRSEYRWDFLRNANRHRLSPRREGARRGDWRVLDTRGDMRRRPKGVSDLMLLPTNYRYGYPSTGDLDASLPPSLVQTGNGSTGIWMYDRPTRRDIRWNLQHEINGRDRDLFFEMETKTRS